jgi:hypothetical protein
MDDTDVEMKSFVEDASPAGDEIIAQEETEHGWRALTAKGELLDVRSRNGHKAAMPDDEVLMIVRGGNAPVSRRSRSIRAQLRIQDYLAHHNRALALVRENRNTDALLEIDAAIALAPTLYARFNRAMILLALGSWREGFAEYRRCEQQSPFKRQPVADAEVAGLKLWDGEDIAGKRLLLLHAHGFGDTIMTLRYVPLLRALGAHVTLLMPDELHALAGQRALVISQICDLAGPTARFDFVCPMLHLLGMLSVTPDTVSGSPYLLADAAAIEQWRARLGPGRHIGIAWSTSAQRPGDYPRSIPLEQLLGADLQRDANLHSVQRQGGLEALVHGVRIHEIGDFADCAAMMLAMDRIVTVDTAAAHLAGAIGHPHVELLLSHWASWRWLAPWYANVKLRWQTIADDWDSALAQLEASDAGPDSSRDMGGGAS